MKKSKWYRYTWEDGTVSTTRGYDNTEMLAQIRKHGKLISKVFAGCY